MNLLLSQGQLLDIVLVGQMALTYLFLQGVRNPLRQFLLSSRRGDSFPKGSADPFCQLLLRGEL
eukprot:1146111-Amphidinium_carterae.1